MATEPHLGTVGPRSLGGLSVLIVDDDEDSVAALCMLLRCWGANPRGAITAESALRAASESAPDVVLLDLGLPRMNGFRVAQALRQQLGEEAPAVVAVTGHQDEKYRRQCEEEGFAACLLKPVEPDELYAVLARLRFSSPTVLVAEPAGRLPAGVVDLAGTSPTT